MPRPLAALALILTLSACMAPPPTSRDVAGSPPAVAERIRAKLGAMGFNVGPGGGTTIDAKVANAEPRFSVCPLVLEDAGQEVMKGTSADSAIGEVTVTVSPAAGGSNVHLTTSFTGSYFSFVRGRWFNGPCASRGIVETELLASAG